MKINSLNNDRIKYFSKLKQKKYRDKEGLFLVEGMHLVLEAYKSGYLKEIILEENEDISFNFNIIYYVPSKLIKKISDLDTPSKVIGVCKKKEEKELGNKVLLLDRIQDPGNLGTIIRSSVAFGMDTIVLSEDSVDLYNSKVIRSTQGMLFHINIISRDASSFINEVKKENYIIYGTKVTNGKDVKKLEKESKYVLIVGNEGQGISDSLLKLCDEYLYINMEKECESLNVAVATSIIIYELNK
ncbi:MAG: RNA methyltransferase [Bacilli bacterium]